jgi:hypothetical protein
LKRVADPFHGVQIFRRPLVFLSKHQVLQLKALGVEDVVGFDFMDKPPRAAVVRRALSDVCGAFCNGGSGAVITVPFAPARPPLPV